MDRILPERFTYTCALETTIPSLWSGKHSVNSLILFSFLCQEKRHRYKLGEFSCVVCWHQDWEGQNTIVATCQNASWWLYGRQALSCKACGTYGMNFVQQNVVMCVVFPIFRKGEVRNFQSHQKKWLRVKRSFASAVTWKVYKWSLTFIIPEVRPWTVVLQNPEEITLQS